MLLAIVNLEKWNSLPKAYQSIIEQAGQTANNWMMAKYDEVNPPAIKRLLRYLPAPGSVPRQPPGHAGKIEARQDAGRRHQP